jgi:hypothetical protein
MPSNRGDLICPPVPVYWISTKINNGRQKPMRMNEKIEIEYPLEELEAGTLISMGFDRNSFSMDGGDVRRYLKRAEDFPPRSLLRKLFPLVVEEAVCPEDISLRIVDWSNGRKYFYDIEEFLRNTMQVHVQSPPRKKDVEFWVRSL